MGTFNVTIEVAAGPEGPFEPIDAIVGLGSTLYSFVPSSILQTPGG